MKIKKLVAFLMASIIVFGSHIVSYAEQSDTIIAFGEKSSSDYVEIEIDGSYDDWEDKPHTQIKYPWESPGFFHLGSLFRDEEYVYLHIKMSEQNYTHFNTYTYNFTIDGKQVPLVISLKNKKIVEGNNEIEVRTQSGHEIIDGSGGFVTRTSGKPDEWEVKIPLSFFSDQPDLIKEITVNSPNLGPQEIISTGTPTLAFLVAGTGFIVAAGSLFYINKRKKNV